MVFQKVNEYASAPFVATYPNQAGLGWHRSGDPISTRSPLLSLVRSGAFSPLIFNRHAAIAHIRMHRIGKIDGSRSSGQRSEIFSLRSKTRKHAGKNRF